MIPSEHYTASETYLKLGEEVHARIVEIQARRRELLTNHATISGMYTEFEGYSVPTGVVQMISRIDHDVADLRHQVDHAAAQAQIHAMLACVPGHVISRAGWSDKSQGVVIQ